MTYKSLAIALAVIGTQALQIQEDVWYKTAQIDAENENKWHLRQAQIDAENENKWNLRQAHVNADIDPSMFA